MLHKSGWPGMRYPDHVNYFTPTTLAQMLKNAGHRRLYMPLRWRLPTSDNLWAVACTENDAHRLPVAQMTRLPHQFPVGREADGPACLSGWPIARIR